MSSKDTRDEPVLKNGKLNRRNMLLAAARWPQLRR